jgi:hypothetical protein
MGRIVMVHVPSRERVDCILCILEPLLQCTFFFFVHFPVVR